MRRPIRLVLAFLMCVPAIPATRALGQSAGATTLTVSSVTPEERHRAAALMEAKNWPEAAKAYGAIAQKEPQNAGARSMFGVCLHFMGQFESAVRAYREALAIQPTPNIYFNLACSLARMNQKIEAVEALSSAVKAGYLQADQLESDADLAALRGEAGFQAVLESAKRAQFPCKYARESRQFDFWVGEWNVFTPQGQQAGTSSVQLILGDCVVFENWTGVRGMSGKSFNTFDQGTGRWQQTWVDDKGSLTNFLEGKYQEGAMRLTAREPQKDGSHVLRHLTFFNQGPDRVRQLGESSTDEGKSWTVDYDLTYIRKN